MPNTTNFNWPTPADTDLVKDGAAAIRNLGDGVDTSLVDLKGGTTGQILSKASNADMDFAFITPNVGDLTEVQAGVGISVASGTGPIPIITNSSTDLITTAGDLLYGTAADTVARLGIGTAGQVLKVNSGATAPEWGAAASGALVLTGSSNFTTSSSVVLDDCFSASYDYYVMYIDLLASSGNPNINIKMRLAGSSASTNYFYNRNFWTGASSTASETSSATSFFIGETASNNATNTAIVVEFVDPAVATPTKIFSKARFLNTNSSLFAQDVYGHHSTSTAYDDLEIIPSTGTIDGSVRIYGYAKS